MKKRNSDLYSILITGASGFVGSTFLSLFKAKKALLLSPSHRELDLNSYSNVFAYFGKHKPTFVINFAAINSIEESEKERNNRKGPTWQTNVTGVKNIKKACEKYRSFLIQISTDAVFPGTQKNPGPYSERNKTAKNLNELNWYGVTKLAAEKEIKKLKKRYAIVRISHLFGNLNFEGDLVKKSLNEIHLGHKLFTDQFFTPTYIEDLIKTIERIIEMRKEGIFHVACNDSIIRIEFDRYVAQKFKIKKKLREGTQEELLKNRALRTRIGGFYTAATQKRLKIKFHNWKKAVDKMLRM